MINNCLICKKSFYAKPSWVKKGYCKFCSKECFDIWQRENKKLGQKSQRWNSIERICRVCGKKFFKCPSRVASGRGIYCSKKCHRKSMIGIKRSKMTEKTRLKISGKNHYNWKGGINYESEHRLKTEEWINAKKIVYKRDNRICQKCGKRCDYKKIACHHIKPWRVSKNNNLDNLITLCRSCHAKEDLLRSAPRARINSFP